MSQRPGHRILGEMFHIILSIQPENSALTREEGGTERERERRERERERERERAREGGRETKTEIEKRDRDREAETETQKAKKAKDGVTKRQTDLSELSGETNVQQWNARTPVLLV